MHGSRSETLPGPRTARRPTWPRGELVERALQDSSRTAPGSSDISRTIAAPPGAHPILSPSPGLSLPGRAYLDRKRAANSEDISRRQRGPDRYLQGNECSRRVTPWTSTAPPSCSRIGRYSLSYRILPCDSTLSRPVRTGRHRSPEELCRSTHHHRPLTDVYPMARQQQLVPGSPTRWQSAYGGSLPSFATTI